MGRERTYTCHNATTRLLHNTNNYYSLISQLTKKASRRLDMIKPNVSKSASKSLANAWHDKAKRMFSFGVMQLDRAKTIIMTDTIRGERP